MSESIVRTRRWTRAEYDRLIDAGFLGPGDKIELLAGQLCVSEPQNNPHARGIWLGQEALRKALPPGWSVLAQLPIALDDESAPEPDLAVVSGGPRDYTDHPSRPALVVEVADSSLAFDRTHKGSLYARARLSEYWIVNLVDHILEVYRSPGTDDGARYGWAYGVMLTLGPDEHVVPLAAPSARISGWLPRPSPRTAATSPSFSPTSSRAAPAERGRTPCARSRRPASATTSATWPPKGGAPTRCAGDSSS